MDDLEKLRREWSDLCDGSPRTTPFQRPEWLIPWWRIFQPGEPWVLAVRKAGRLAALAPFLFYRKDGERTVAFCGGGVSDYLDVVTEPETEEEATAILLGHLAVERERWQAGDFEPVPGESPLLRAAPPDGLEARTEPRDICPVLPLPREVEGLRGVVPTRQLSNLRKYRRKADSLGDFRLEVGDGEGWKRLIGILERLYAARWREQGRYDLAEDEKLREMLRQAAAGFAVRDALALYALQLNGEPLAALLGFRERDTVYFYRQGIDPQQGKLSPGVMIVGAAIEDNIRRGARRFDFLRGSETYKYWWGAKDRQTFRRTFNPPRSNPGPGE